LLPKLHCITLHYFLLLLLLQQYKHLLFLSVSSFAWKLQSRTNNDTIKAWSWGKQGSGGVGGGGGGEEARDGGKKQQRVGESRSFCVLIIYD
jgi:hypothetical protein